MNSQSIENDRFLLTLRTDGGFEFCLKLQGRTYCQLPSEYQPVSMKTGENRICLDIKRSDGICRVIAELTENGFSVTISSEGEQRENFAWPPAWKMEKGDVGIYPVGTGIAVPADDLSFPLKNGDRPFGSGMSSPLAFYGFLRDGNGVFSAPDDGLYAAMQLNTSDHLRHARTVWYGSKGIWGEDKRIRFFFAGSLSEGCRMYRRWREEEHKVLTLKEKCKITPEAEKLAGLADLWLWDDNNMNRLYGRPEEPETAPRIPEKIADELEDLGMKHILWNSFEGETPESCAYLKSKGFLVGKYDIYRDVLPKTEADKIIPYRVKRSVNTPYWPGIVRIREDGSYAPAWQIHGLDGKLHDQHAVCDLAAAELTEKNVTPDVERVGYTSRLIDVQAGSMPGECWSSEHPATRRDSLEAIKKQHRFLCGIGLVTGVEVGNELSISSCHYTEGMMSPVEFRAPDAGRRMTTIYDGGEIPEFFEKYMLNPLYRIPLWQLIYHDCIASYWYWGDSSNCCPALMPLRDLFCALYGEGPLYSLSAGQWVKMKKEIAASYRRATPVCAAVRFAEMLSFEYLSDDKLIQRTKFANGIAVTANFSGKLFRLENGTMLEPKTYYMEKD